MCAPRTWGTQNSFLLVRNHNVVVLLEKSINFDWQLRHNPDVVVSMGGASYIKLEKFITEKEIGRRWKEHSADGSKDSHGNTQSL
ncbi:hypothetical protein RRG08_046752 [Elysia crispata]|uniref:Uncharacterized protein n=1 Tax=Elysia crispata TaxID=231223 RepID=A0AAE1DN84_9GAST|nr:hypothetical protein RRG08_046752 [Elysia crispata]